MAKKPPGFRPCVDGTGPPAKKFSPTGGVIVIVIYWMAQIPLFDQWSATLSVALHTAAVGATVQYVVQLGGPVRRAAALVWRVVSAISRRAASYVSRAWRWMISCEIAVSFRLGARPAEAC